MGSLSRYPICGGLVSWEGALSTPAASSGGKRLIGHEGGEEVVGAGVCGGKFVGCDRKEASCVAD